MKIHCRCRPELCSAGRLRRFCILYGSNLYRNCIVCSH